MLDHVFRRPSVRDRIRANPLGKWVPGYIRYAREFLGGKFGEGPIDWADLCPADPIAFVDGYAARCRPGTAQVVATSLRSSPLRLLQSTARCPCCWWPLSRASPAGRWIVSRGRCPTTSFADFWTPSTVRPLRVAATMPGPAARWTWDGSVKFWDAFTGVRVRSTARQPETSLLANVHHSQTCHSPNR